MKAVHQLQIVSWDHKIVHEYHHILKLDNKRYHTLNVRSFFMFPSELNIYLNICIVAPYIVLPWQFMQMHRTSVWINRLNCIYHFDTSQHFIMEICNSNQQKWPRLMSTMRCRCVCGRCFYKNVLARLSITFDPCTLYMPCTLYIILHCPQIHIIYGSNHVFIEIFVMNFNWSPWFKWNTECSITRIYIPQVIWICLFNLWFYLYLSCRLTFIRIHICVSM